VLAAERSSPSTWHKVFTSLQCTALKRPPNLQYDHHRVKLASSNRRHQVSGKTIKPLWRRKNNTVEQSGRGKESLPSGLEIVEPEPAFHNGLAYFSVQVPLSRSGENEGVLSDSKVKLGNGLNNEGLDPSPGLVAHDAETALLEVARH
jgi:hypothetical protein